MIQLRPAVTKLFLVLIFYCIIIIVFFLDCWLAHHVPSHCPKLKLQVESTSVSSPLILRAVSVSSSTKMVCLLPLMLPLMCNTEVQLFINLYSFHPKTNSVK